MTDRCEPPEELRGVDGDFWIERGGVPSVHVWLAAPQCWLIGTRDAKPGDMHAMGWRYLAPVTPPAEVEALRAERDALQAEKDAYESPAWEANEQLNAECDTLRATGYAVVPSEASVDMLVAGTEAWLVVAAMEDLADAIWSAMISAAEAGQ